MTIGIYKLVFKGTDKVYIGQSIDINRRFKEHLNDLKKNQSHGKLQEAYNVYGKPSLETILECTVEELNNSEVEAIEIFDSYNNGFNTLKEPGSPNLRGCDSPHAKYSKETYIKVFKDIVHTKKLLREIAEDYGVTWNIVMNISLGRTHLWLKEDFPEEYELLKAKIGVRQRKSLDRLVVSPEGEIFEVDVSIREFCRIHEINSTGTGGHLGNVLNGKRKSYKGWVKYTEVLNK